MGLVCKDYAHGKLFGVGDRKCTVCTGGSGATSAHVSSPPSTNWEMAETNSAAMIVSTLSTAASAGTPSPGVPATHSV